MDEKMNPSEPPRRDFREITGMDPAANWLLEYIADDFASDEKDQEPLIPFLIELEADAVGPFRAALDRHPGAQVLGFGAENDVVREGVLLPVVATRSWLLALLDDGDEGFLKSRKRLMFSSPLDQLTEEKEYPPRPQSVLATPPSSGVVVAAIDDGFAFAHERFLADDGVSTGIERFWDMGQGYPLMTPPAGELNGTEVDGFVAGTKSGVLVDEDAAYQRAGLLNFRSARHKPLAWRTSHGTHVLDLAIGSDPGTGGPPILAVQLPSPVVARTTGELLDFYVWLGILYILDRAGDRPLVVNISFGYDAGPHDGMGLLEKHLSLAIANRGAPTCIVLPSGNAQLSRCHAEIDLVARSRIELDWIVLPDDRTHSIVEIWLPKEAAQGDRITLTVIEPDGTPHALAEDMALPPVMLTARGKVMGLVELWERLDGRRMFRIAVAPTMRPQPVDRPLAPAGVWTLRFDRGGAAETIKTPAQVWVQRDDSLYGYPQRGRQSYLDHPEYERFDEMGYARDDDPPGSLCPVTRKSLLNAIASSENVVVAGGYRTRDGRVARYSCGGPNTPPETPATRHKPDVLLPSDGSPAHPGVLAAGARSGARVAMDGTSVASPELARYIAGWLASLAPADRDAVQLAGAMSAILPGATPMPDRDGHGRLPRADASSLVARFEPGD